MNTNGIWIIWIMFFVFAAISIILLSGHGANLIAGYNTASDEEKEKYNTKKMCRTVGSGIAVIALIILVIAVGHEKLPDYLKVILFALIVTDIIAITLLVNKTCKK